jgi:soluble lytic murein transglycosylase-like protein
MILNEFHSAFDGGCQWRISPAGCEVRGFDALPPPQYVTGLTAALDTFAGPLAAASREFSVPVELLCATMMTESNGRPGAVRKEPGYTSDEQTPHRISFGLCQLLISTAREAMGDPRIDRAWLTSPANNLRAAAAYIKRQKTRTGFDPPKVACAYNAGGCYEQKGEKNHWRMRQYPIGTSEHADRFVRWFNAAWVLSKTGKLGAESAYRFEDFLK